MSRGYFIFLFDMFWNSNMQKNTIKGHILCL